MCPGPSGLLPRLPPHPWEQPGSQAPPGSSPGYGGPAEAPAAGSLLEPEEGQDLPVGLQAATCPAPLRRPSPYFSLPASSHFPRVGAQGRSSWSPSPEPGDAHPLLEPKLLISPLLWLGALLRQREVQGTLGDCGHIFLRPAAAAAAPAGTHLPPPGPGDGARAAPRGWPRGTGPSCQPQPKSTPQTGPHLPHAPAPTSHQTRPPTAPQTRPRPPLMPGPHLPSRLVPTSSRLVPTSPQALRPFHKEEAFPSGDQRSPWLSSMVAELAWASAASQGTLSLALVSASHFPCTPAHRPQPWHHCAGEERPQGLHLSSGRQGP